MDKEIWKQYEDNALTHSAAHYLMTIRELIDDQGYARVTDIARQLSITRGSCSISLKPLKRRGLVVEDQNRFLRLSDEGERLAALVERNDQLLQIFFRDVLGVDAEQAEIDACKIEHLISLETSMGLAAFVECVNGGSDAVKNFLGEVRKFKSGCANDVENCHVCQSVCFLDDQE